MAGSASTGGITGGITDEVTVVLSVAVLLSWITSLSLALTVAVLVMVPTERGVTTISTVAFDPARNAPRLQATVPPDGEQLPCDGLVESNVPGGKRVGQRHPTGIASAQVVDRDPIGQPAIYGHRIG